ncbi:MAG TPA: alpha/beta hydrolase [Candidatus Limnocylindria bacterium]|jgi:pimeloyl-ACP methyl ester carboxylesterase|nr:alpha/beta hydrolase [Candidatus Limnocylindria bacterium]
MTTPTATQSRGYTDIGGHRTWFADSGSTGEPVLVLHGGLSDSELLLDRLEPALGDRFRILAFDRRGHGRTADTDAAFHYDDMATETITAIEELVAGPAHLVGWSDGGNVALLVALRRPDLIRSLVLIGANYSFDGNVTMEPVGNEPQFLKNRYAERSPDGAEHFSVMFKKSRAMWAVEPTLNTDDLRRISAPALVLVGDDDLMTLAHTASLYESLPLGQLAVVPGTSHAVVMEKPELVGRLIGDFLSAPEKPETHLPVRRRAAAK